MSTTAEITEAREEPVAAEAPPTAPAGIAEQQVALYRYSTWVHVGPGAENCEAFDGEHGTCDCSNPLHFHAWCRLPNQFTHRDIREKALAAKARRFRQLRHEGTDGYEILESELDAMLRSGDEGKEQIISELVGREWYSDLLEAAQNVREHEAEDGTKPFEHVEDDQRRYKELEDGDERTELESHLDAYSAKLEEAAKAIVEPKKAALRSNDLPALVNLIREQRIDLQASAAFMDTYNAYSWLTGTFTSAATATRSSGKPSFASIEELEQAAPEVIDALRETFNDLENTERGAAGNS